MATTNKTKKDNNYIEGIGGRKTSTARVRIYPSDKKKDFVINEKPLDEYFSLAKNIQTSKDPFKILGDEYHTTVKVQGGGTTAQAEAIRHGLSRALIKHDEDLRKQLKSKGFLTRDPRKKERKKPGLRKARRPQQWRKR